VYIHASGGIGPNAAPIRDSLDPGNSAIATAPRAALNADALPVNLRNMGKSLGIAMPRLISRFAELAVVGAQLCANEFSGTLPTQTSLYLATGLGDVARTDSLYYQVMPPSSEMASPAQFATSGNNMAGFFVAQHLQLVSRNITVAQQDLSLEHALALALDDLTAGAASTVLVGGVDETTVTREFYVRRYPLSADKYIGEGSAWLVLGTQASSAIGELISCVIIPPGDADHEDAWAHRAAVIIRSLIDTQSAATFVPGGRISPPQIAALRERFDNLTLHDYRDTTGCFPTAAAVAIVGAFVEIPPTPRTYIHVNCDAQGRTGVIAWSVYQRTTTSARE
jgi:hypothetical protein